MALGSLDCLCFPMSRVRMGSIGTVSKADMLSDCLMGVFQKSNKYVFIYYSLSVLSRFNNEQNTESEVTPASRGIQSELDRQYTRQQAEDKGRRKKGGIDMLLKK